MKRTLWLFGGLVAAGVLAVAAFAQPGLGAGPGPESDLDDFMPGGLGMGRGGNGPGAGAGMMMRRLAALDLSSDQWARVRQIHLDTQKQIIPKQADVRVAQIDLQQLMQVDQPNMNQIDAKITEIATKRAEVQKLRVRMLMQVRGVLTDEQRQKFLNPAWHPSEAQGPAGLENRPMLRRRMMRDQ